MQEGLAAVQELKREGRIGAVSFGIYPMDIWHRIFNDYDVDAALIHNHYCLHDTRLLELLPMAKAKGIGLINASPFGSGLLTDRGPADWHPANAAERAIFAKAAAFCREQGTSISQLALQFSSQHPEIPTTLFSSAHSESVRQNVFWHEQPFDGELLAQVRKILTPVMNQEWDYDAVPGESGKPKASASARFINGSKRASLAPAAPLSVLPPSSLSAASSAP